MKVKVFLKNLDAINKLSEEEKACLKEIKITLNDIEITYEIELVDDINKVIEILKNKTTV